MKKIFNHSSFILAFLFLININSCSKNNLVESAYQPFIMPTKKILINDLQPGDLIFVGALKENLSGAINRVTQTSENRSFDHVGLTEKTNDSIFVLHANPKGGSQRETIYQFYQNQKNNQNQIIIYRLKKPYQNTITNAIIKAKTMLNKPYNWTYILNDDSFYCSDFIERAFREDSIFKLIPMNFKNPTTREIDDFWVNFYAKLNLNVPQNEPGTNPNQLAESDKLTEIGALFIETN